MPLTSPPSATITVLLDQLPPVDLAIRGRYLEELLRPAYRAFGAATAEERTRAQFSLGACG